MTPYTEGQKLQQAALPHPNFVGFGRWDHGKGGAAELSALIPPPRQKPEGCHGAIPQEPTFTPDLTIYLHAPDHDRVSPPET